MCYYDKIRPHCLLYVINRNKSKRKKSLLCVYEKENVKSFKNYVLKQKYSMSYNIIL